MSETIQVSIGSEPRCHIPAEVLKSSIIRRTSLGVEFTHSWLHKMPIGNNASMESINYALGVADDPWFEGWHPLMKSGPQLKRGTRFSAWRWHVPAAHGHQGRVIYLDSDQVVLADIAGLWDALTPGHMLACVSNVDGNDWWGYPKTIIDARKRHKDKLQTSVMVMDCAACDWDFPAVAKANSYGDLMQGEFLPRTRVQTLDPQWNRFGRCDTGTKLLHWSHVGSQPWRWPKHPTRHIWRVELDETIAAGHLSRDVLREEIKRGHVHKVFAP